MRKIILLVLIGFLLNSCENYMKVKEVDSPSNKVIEVFTEDTDELLSLDIESFLKTNTKKVSIVTKGGMKTDEFWKYEFVFDGIITVKENCFKVAVQGKLFDKYEYRILTEREYMNGVARLGDKVKEMGLIEGTTYPAVETESPFKTWTFLKKGKTYKVKGKFKLESPDDDVISSISDLEITDCE